MRIDVLVAILAMAVAAYATRAGGLWLMGWVKPSPRAEAWLRVLPGAVLVAIIVPEVVAGGLAALLATLATLLVAARTKNLLVALGVGVAAIWVLRQVI